MRRIAYANNNNGAVFALNKFSGNNNNIVNHILFNI